ncbi:hypothetical protein Bcop_0919 [Bacteroides coprosuis DSM 18011]|jgi:hypothetical protein|uniref:Uncharacterized protein n=1 Tax=Bacteroides coprosuis DSM 18011 TaxID=679937 RepID=F3ZU27_9BACE|nr:hypothetical protein Bcop_0919 [Bacteroides coprosuis DSM 18011]
MKATNHFTRTILTYLELRAESDTLFAESFAKENKNIDDCITYIFNEVQKSGCMGFADDEIYSIAVHYYDYPNLYKNLTSCTNQLIIIANNIKR